MALIEAGVDTPPDHTDQVLWDSYPIIAYFDRRHQWTDLRVRTRPDGPLRTYEQARVMGGGSSINGQMANRGQPLDYDEWAEDGAAGWTWQNVRPISASSSAISISPASITARRPDADPPGAAHGMAGLLAARWRSGRGLRAALDRGSERLSDSIPPASRSRSTTRTIAASLGRCLSRPRCAERARI